MFVKWKICFKLICETAYKEEYNSSRVYCITLKTTLTVDFRDF